jgi:hypothetical protein
MKITRQTETDLVFEDSTYWLSTLFAGFAVLMAYAMLRSSTQRGLIGAGLLLLFAFAWLRRSTMVFDTKQRVVRWSRKRWGRTLSGSVPFDAIENVVVQNTRSENSAMTYRLALETKAETIPFCDPYSGGGQARYDAMREAALKMLGRPSPANADGLDASIRSLLHQGRTVDAVELVRASDRLTLSAARERVLQVREQISAMR